MNTTLVIQGRLDQDSYDFYSLCYRDTPKIFSTWSNCKVKFNKEGLQSVLLNETPKCGFKRQNINLQVFSTMKGLECVETTHAFKLRGDEKFSGLSEIRPEFHDGIEKILVAPIFFRKWDDHPFHISDHIMFGNFSDLKTMFEQSWATINSKEALERHVLFKNSSETIIGKSYLDFRTKEDLKPNENSKNIFKKHFGIINLEKLMPYEISFRGKKTNFFEPKKARGICRMDEL